ENDVEASHAASVGQPDPEAIYYLQSRGLTLEKTMEMITLGYLMPIVNVIENESIREELTETIHAKVVG
ncbi:MAG: SufD family Fe-S cluster assembly protein, partial [Erysipelothrix sp.]|nr:SufD family Fe-S cluster assembly protein [Erysipelothrix sp.]